MFLGTENRRRTIKQVPNANYRKIILTTALDDGVAV